MAAGNMAIGGDIRGPGRRLARPYAYTARNVVVTGGGFHSSARGIRTAAPARTASGASAETA